MPKKAPVEIIKLSDTDKKMLTDLSIDLDRAKKAVVLLKEMGVNTSSIDDKIAFSEKARNTLLKEFG